MSAVHFQSTQARKAANTDCFAKHCRERLGKLNAVSDSLA